MSPVPGVLVSPGAMLACVAVGGGVTVCCRNCHAPATAAAATIVELMNALPAVYHSTYRATGLFDVTGRMNAFAS